MKSVLRLLRGMVALGLAALVYLYACALIFVWLGRQGTAVTFPADCAVVFGAAIHPLRNSDGNITGYSAGPGILRRVEAAADLYRQGKIRKLFLSGGKGVGAPVSEAQVMQKEAIRRGVKVGDIRIEERSTSTKENIAFTRPLTQGCRGIVGVSDDYHLARIRVLSQVAGWDIQTYPAAHTKDGLFFFENWLREATGISLLVMERLLT